MALEAMPPDLTTYLATKRAPNGARFYVFTELLQVRNTLFLSRNSNAYYLIYSAVYGIFFVGFCGPQMTRKAGLGVESFQSTCTEPQL